MNRTRKLLLVSSSALATSLGLPIAALADVALTSGLATTGAAITGNVTSAMDDPAGHEFNISGASRTVDSIVINHTGNAIFLRNGTTGSGAALQVTGAVQIDSGKDLTFRLSRAHVSGAVNLNVSGGLFGANSEKGGTLTLAGEHNRGAMSVVNINGNTHMTSVAVIGGSPGTPPFSDRAGTQVTATFGSGSGSTFRVDDFAVTGGNAPIQRGSTVNPS